MTALHADTRFKCGLSVDMEQGRFSHLYEIIFRSVSDGDTVLKIYWNQNNRPQQDHVAATIYLGSDESKCVSGHVLS